MVSCINKFAERLSDPSQERNHVFFPTYLLSKKLYDWVGDKPFGPHVRHLRGKHVLKQIVRGMAAVPLGLFSLVEVTAKVALMIFCFPFQALFSIKLSGYLWDASFQTAGIMTTATIQAFLGKPILKIASSES